MVVEINRSLVEALARVKREFSVVLYCNIRRRTHSHLENVDVDLYEQWYREPLRAQD
jgi:hypothetical protein